MSATQYVEVLSTEDYRTWRTDTAGKRTRCADRWRELDQRGELVRVVTGDARLIIDTDGRRP